MKILKKKYIYIIIIIFLIVPLYRSFSPTTPSYESPILIAHAGGCIDGFQYTNSIEATLNSINNGFNAFELDLLLSSDSIIVAAHDWNSFRHKTNHSFMNDTLSFSEFSSLKLHNKYTPMTPQLIDSIMTLYPNITLVTDKISTPSVINQYFSKYKNRLKIECFSIPDYFELKDMGYNGAAYSGVTIDLILSELKYLFCISNKRVTNLILSNITYNKYRKIVRWWCSPKSISLWGRPLQSDYEYQSDVESLYVEQL